MNSFFFFSSELIVNRILIVSIVVNKIIFIIITIIIQLLLLLFYIINNICNSLYLRKSKGHSKFLRSPLDSSSDSVCYGTGTCNAEVVSSIAPG